MLPLDGMMVIIHSIARAKKCCGWWPPSHQGARCPKVISFLYASLNWLCHLNFLIEVWGGNGDKNFPYHGCWVFWMLLWPAWLLSQYLSRGPPKKHWSSVIKFNTVSTGFSFSAHQFFVAGLISALLWKTSLKHPFDHSWQDAQESPPWHFVGWGQLQSYFPFSSVLQLLRNSPGRFHQGAALQLQIHVFWKKRYQLCWNVNLRGIESQCLLYLILEQKSDAFWVVRAIANSLLASIALWWITLGSSRCGDCIVKPLGYWMVNKSTISSAQNSLLGCFFRRVRAKRERERKASAYCI